MSPADDVNNELAQWRHEVRNRLHLIRGYAALLEMEGVDDDLREYVREIGEAAKEIQGLLDEHRDHVMPTPSAPSREVRLD